MARPVKWLIVAATALIALGLVVGIALWGWFVVRPFSAQRSATGTDTVDGQVVPGSTGLWTDLGAAGGAGSCSFGPGGSGCDHGAPGLGEALTLAEARQAIERYLATYGNSDLEVGAVIEFEQNFYAVVKEKSSKIGAFELVVDKRTAVVRPEPGPSMTWNIRYGVLARRRVGGTYAIAGGAMRLSPGEALLSAQRWLDRNLPGVRAHPGDAYAFYGYYTFSLWQDGKMYGMLSVNGQTGRVWQHSWHGAFIAVQDGEGD